MSEESQDRRTLSVGTIVAWPLGVMALLAMITYITQLNLVGMVMMAIATVITLPPLRQRIEQRLDVVMTRWFVVTVDIVVFVLAGMST